MATFKIWNLSEGKLAKLSRSMSMVAIGSNQKFFINPNILMTMLGVSLLGSNLF